MNWFFCIRAAPLAKKTASLIEKETDERPTFNIEHRIMYSVNLKKDGQSESILGNYAVAGFKIDKA